MNNSRGGQPHQSFMQHNHICSPSDEQVDAQVIAYFVVNCLNWRSIRLQMQSMTTLRPLLSNTTAHNTGGRVLGKEVKCTRRCDLLTGTANQPAHLLSALQSLTHAQRRFASNGPVSGVEQTSSSVVTAVSVSQMPTAITQALCSCSRAGGTAASEERFGTIYALRLQAKRQVEVFETSGC